MIHRTKYQQIWRKGFRTFGYW